MTSLKYLFFIVSLILLIACTENKHDNQDSRSVSDAPDNSSKSRSAQKNIIVYGSMECNHCHEFRRKLESKGITYEFRDVDQNNTYFIELQNLIRSINYKGYVRYPVIKIDEEVFVNPDFREIETKMYNSPD